MSTIQASFGQTLTRASLLPLFLFSALVAYLVPSALFTDHVAPAPEPETPVVWKAEYSEQYPGCVSTALWPASERPAALVVLSADGNTALVTTEEARQQAAVVDHARTIGACRNIE